MADAENPKISTAARTEQDLSGSGESVLEVGRRVLETEAEAVRSSLMVVDEDLCLTGVLHLHDLWRTQMF